MTRRPLLALVGMSTLAMPALAGGCSVDEGAFQARVFACDTAAKDPRCGKDLRDGKPMTCFPASQLDGTDFCTPSCDAPMSLPGENAVCVQGAAKLAFCNPEDDLPEQPSPCGPDLACLRTDVTSDEGVCVTMQPCTADSDCPNPVRSTCAATFLHQLYAQNPEIHSDHLYCLQKNCVAGGSACAPGQSCLPDHDHCGTTRRCPTTSKSGSSRLLAWSSASMEVLNWSAMLPSESPGSTV